MSRYGDYRPDMESPPERPWGDEREDADPDLARKEAAERELWPELFRSESEWAEEKQYHHARPTATERYKAAKEAAEREDADEHQRCFPE